MVTCVHCRVRASFVFFWLTSFSFLDKGQFFVVDVVVVCSVFLSAGAYDILGWISIPTDC